MKNNLNYIIMLSQLCANNDNQKFFDIVFCANNSSQMFSIFKVPIHISSETYNIQIEYCSIPNTNRINLIKNTIRS